MLLLSLDWYSNNARDDDRVYFTDISYDGGSTERSRANTAPSGRRRKVASKKRVAELAMPNHRTIVADPLKSYDCRGMLTRDEALFNTLKEKVVPKRPLTSRRSGKVSPHKHIHYFSPIFDSVNSSLMANVVLQCSLPTCLISDIK